MNLPNVLLVGSTARNAGKTTFCTGFINKWKHHFNVIAVKVTTIHGENGVCRLGGEGCGACSSLCGDYEIIAETNQQGHKDTRLLLAAGALKVYWVRAKEQFLPDAASKLAAMLPPDSVVVCESNSLAGVVTPGACVLMHNNSSDIKPSSAPFFERADVIVDITKPGAVNAVMERIVVENTPSGVCVRSK